MDYKTLVTQIGAMVPEFAEQGIIIVFNDNAPPELAEIAVGHTDASLDKNVSPGDVVVFGSRDYVVTAVGGEANATMRTMGHCTLSFSGRDLAELPGYLELKGEKMPELKIGDRFEILFSDSK